MIWVIKLIGILFILAGISFFVDPAGVYGWIENSRENPSLYISAIVARLVLGGLLIASAKESQYPGVISFIGYLIIIAALVLIFIGHSSFQDLISSLISFIKPISFVSGLFAMAFGGFLVYAFTRNKESQQELN